MWRCACCGMLRRHSTAITSRREYIHTTTFQQITTMACNSQGFWTPWWWFRLSGRNMLEWLNNNKLINPKLICAFFWFVLFFNYENARYKNQNKNSKLVQWLVFEVDLLGSTLGWVRNSLRHCIQTGPKADLVSYQEGTDASSTWDLAVEEWSWPFTTISYRS